MELLIRTGTHTFKSTGGCRNLASTLALDYNIENAGKFHAWGVFGRGYRLFLRCSSISKLSHLASRSHSVEICHENKANRTVLSRRLRDGGRSHPLSNTQ